MHTSFAVKNVIFSVAFFLALLLCMQFGMWLAHRRPQPVARPLNVNAVEASIFGLLGLLVAFTFYGAAGRFESRHEMVVQEVAAILTAWERIDLLPDSTQPALREEFRRYLDARLDAYRLSSDPRQFFSAVEAAHVHYDRLRSLAEATTSSHGDVTGLVLPPLGEMRNRALARVLAADVHAPLAIYVVLCVLAFVSATLVGVDMQRAGKSWAHMISFAASITLAVYLVIELEFPRQGLVRTDRYDRALLNVRSYLFEEQK